MFVTIAAWAVVELQHKPVNYIYVCQFEIGKDGNEDPELVLMYPEHGSSQCTNGTFTLRTN